MIQITPQMRILIYISPVDFRKGIDGLAKICKYKMQSEPFSGQVFVFRNRKKTAIKILMYDGQGFWVCQKRLSQGTFKWWPDSKNDRVCSLAAYELQLLLLNGNPDAAEVAPEWKKL